ncbi:MAG: molybdopterin-binding protein [Syntrophotaleaceae bacterium]
MVPDEGRLLEQTLMELCDEQHCCLVVTTGGTGPAVRDIPRRLPRRCATR